MESQNEDQLNLFAEGSDVKKQKYNPQAEFAWADPTRIWRTINDYITYNPSILVTRKGLEVFDKMRQDDQIKAALSFKKHSILSTGWEVVSPEGEDRDWEVTEFVWYVLEHIQETFDEALFGILSAMDYGFAISEKCWNNANIKINKSRNDYLVLEALKIKKPHSFDFETDKFGNLKHLVQIQDGSKIELPLDKFVMFTYEKEFGNCYGKSDLESCFRPWWAKHNSYQWLVMYLERLGIPPVFALYDPNAYSPAQKTALKDIMVNMQAATFGIMPRPNRPDVKADQILDFWSPEIASQAKDVFMPALDMFNQDIARAVLMPGLIGFTPDAREGSYARSKKHFDVFMMVVEYIRRKLEKRVVMEQIIKPLVDLNYNVDSYPVFKFLPMTEEVRSDLLDRWLQAVEKGIVLPQKEDEIHIRTLLRFPEKDNDIPAPGPMKQQDKPPAQNEKVDEKPETDKKFAEDNNVSDLFIRIEIDSDKKLRLIFKDMEESLIGFISKNWDLRSKWVNDLKLKYLSDMQEVLRETCRMSHSKGEMSVESLDVFAVNSLKWVTQKALLHSTSLKDSLLNACKLLILNTINSNESKDECVLKIKEIFLNLNTSMLLKSMINESYSQGVLCKAKELGSTKIKGLQYMTVQDSSTSQACSILMNKIFKLDDPDIVRFSPPNGYNCRSYWKPVFNVNTLNINDYVTEQIKGIVKDKLPSKFGGSPA